MKITRMRNYHIKAYSNQIKTWKKCAKKCHLSVSQWVRDALSCVAMGSLYVPFGETEMVRGRKSEDDEIAESFQFRITDWERQEWAQCADQTGLAIGEWCRQSLDWMARSDCVIDLRKVA